MEVFEITRVLLESIGSLAAILGIGQCVLIALWAWRRGRRLARSVWIGFGVIPALLALSLLVVTPRERIIAVYEALSEAVVKEDVVAIGSHLSTDLEAGRLDREGFLESVERTLNRYRVQTPMLHRFEVTFQEDGAGVALFNSRAQVESDHEAYGWLPLRWRLTFRRANRTWRVARIETLPIAPYYIKDVHALIR
ncbi:MAG: hypothetical protein IID43_02885 [Planctomycetes bacterium]|nr:hypothetical protein [Planctomycetota bacterium]